MHEGSTPELEHQASTSKTDEANQTTKETQNCFTNHSLSLTHSSYASTPLSFKYSQSSLAISVGVDWSVLRVTSGLEGSS